MRPTFLALLLASLACPADWTTFGHDSRRSGWAFEETAITPANVANMELKWASGLKSEAYRLHSLTAPVVASDVSTKLGNRSVVYVAGVTGTVFALDAQTGESLWSYTFKSPILPGKGGYQGTFLCPNGITATPVIDKGTNILYVIAPDGSLYGLDLGSGKVRYGPVQFVAPYSKNYSLNLVNGVVYTTLAQGCGGGLSGIYAVDVADRHHPVVRQMLLSNTNTAGIWGRGGPIIGDNNRVYGQTADGKFDPAAGDYSNTIIAASLPDLRVADYYLPANWSYLNKKDLDLGATSPVYFGWRNRHLLAGGAKEGVVYLMDADSLGGADHQTILYSTPKIGNDRDVCCEGMGIWGGLSTARDETGQTWLFVPMGGPISEKAPKFAFRNGETSHGALVAFKVVEDATTRNPILEPAWVSGDIKLPEPAVIANGVVFVLANGENAQQRVGQDKRMTEDVQPAVLKALDMKTGKELYNSGSAMKSWVHFSGLAIADGRVFAVDHDSNVYCFGLKAQPK